MLTVRSMQTSDINAVSRIEKSAHKSPWSYTILSDCVLVGYDCRVLENSDERGVKQIVGYLIGRRSFNTYHILNLCIAPVFQHQGFGKFLIKTLLDSLIGDIIKVIILEVRPSNIAALALYHSFGFQEDEVKKGYYKDSTGEEDALLLKKILVENVKP